MINAEGTLTVGDLMEALKAGRVTLDTRLGYAVRGFPSDGVEAIVSISFHKYEDGTCVLVFLNDVNAPQVARDAVPLEAEDLT